MCRCFKSLLVYLVGWCCLLQPLASPMTCGTEPTEAADLPKDSQTVNPPSLPLVQMLVSGFEVVELPIELTNVNNVRFRPDGKLVTLGYNGDVHLLSDTNGDGLEDHAEVFWKNEGSLRGPIGMLLTPEGYVHGQGLFTPSKGKLSLIVDENGDDRADREIIVADGWEEIAPRVDATGIAMSADGWLYFGLGTADYSNAYQVDQAGVAHFSLDSERGSVQRVSPDFKTRETVCTGIRFPIAFAFNQQGDLFCTEQEGATWLANGNPFDELLHVQAGHHYGFPPRHPRHNPSVIDEPSTFDFGPQHQSTCGMVFNDPQQGATAFGPERWSGDAIICGESRGKLWRTTLVPTAPGYVAQTQLIACLQMLTVDACVAPNGDLVVACHSGPPDWGTGPMGIGKLFRIKMQQSHAPRPVAVWAASQREICIAWDKPLDPQRLQGLAEKIHIEYGEYVRAGDRYETLMPPYAAVKQQLSQPRSELAVTGVAVSADLRTLMIATQPLTADVSYAVTVPSFDDADQTASIVQQPYTDVALSLNGVSAEWTGPAAAESWAGWLPHLDWKVADRLTLHSTQHDDLRQKLATGGTLTLGTQLDLKDILRPQQQPGTTLDYQWPQEIATLVVQSSHPFSMAVVGDVQVAAQPVQAGFEARLTVPPEQASNVSLELQISVQAEGPPLDWSVAMFTNEDARRRPLPLARFRLPWIQPQQTRPEAAEELEIAELSGGDWGRGRRVFHSAAAACFQCHAMGGVGEKIGPDLGNLPHRDYASVLRDIQHPSYAINPDYISQVIETTDGQIITGVIRSEQGELVVGQADGKILRLSPSQVVGMRTAATSLMPSGVTEKLTSEQLRDLMTYLLRPAPQMPLAGKLEAPPVRTQAELSQLLAGSEPRTTAALRELKIILVAGTKDHGPGEHDYPAWQTQWGQLLAAAEDVAVEAAWDFPSPAQMADADVLMFFQKGDWDDRRQTEMDQYFARGGGAVYIHWAVNGNDRVADFSQRIGLSSRGGSISYRHGPLSLITHNTDHPIMRNIDQLELYDESYWLLTGNPENVTLFASSVEDGQARPQVWGYERNAGRVFVSIPGHYNWTFDDPIFRTLLLRGTLWTARESVDRFNELVPLGARLAR